MRARPLLGALAVSLALGACSSATSASSKSTSPPVAQGLSAEATYFYNHRDRLAPAPAQLSGAITLALASWQRPSKPVGPGQPSLTLSLSVGYQGTGPDIVVLDVIPWRIGDVKKGPGALLSKTQRYGFSLRAGERADVDIPVIVQRVGPPPTSAPTAPGGAVPGGAVPGEPVPVAPGSSVPGGRSSVPGSSRSLGGIGVLALGPAEQVPPGTPSSTVPITNAAPRPSATPLGPPLPGPSGGPFDPQAGLQVILVAAYAGDGIAPDAFRNVALVQDDRFAATYGRYVRVEQGVGVPLDQIL
jgi:hypothetical protein